MRARDDGAEMVYYMGQMAESVSSLVEASCQPQTKVLDTGELAPTIHETVKKYAHV